MPSNEQLIAEMEAELLPKLRAIRARKAAVAEAIKPKLEVRAAITPKMAEAIKANPATLRVSAKASDDTVVIDRPRRTEIIEVLEVDGATRPAFARRYEAATGEWSTVEFDGGYRRRPGAQSDYDPFARGLKGSNDD